MTTRPVDALTDAERRVLADALTIAGKAWTDNPARRKDSATLSRAIEKLWGLR